LEDFEFESVAVIVTYFIGIGQLVHLTGSDLHGVSQWLVLGLTFSLITNISVTCLIAGKLWIISRSNCLSLVTTRCTAVVWAILESGGVYVITMVLLVAFTAMETQVGVFISNLFVQLCVSPIFSHEIFVLVLTLSKGIIPALIIVRVGPGLMADRVQTNIVAEESGQSQMEKYEIQHHEVHKQKMDIWI
jgi:hypothetical protein